MLHGEENNGDGTVKETVNSASHGITVAAEQLKRNDLEVRLSGFDDVHIAINTGSVRIRVDGKTVMSTP